MVTRYDVINSRWSSHFWVKIYVFSTSFKKKVNLVAKNMQSAYLCVIFHVKQKITISCGFNLISNSWWNPRWQPRWRPFLVTSPTSSSATTRKIYLILRLSTQDKIVSRYCNISKTPGRGSIQSPPPLMYMYYGGGMSLRVRPRVNQTSFLAVKTVLSWRPRRFVSTKKYEKSSSGLQ